MNIPLDRLYHFINNIASEIYGDRVLIYRFYPHGSKNISDLKMLYTATWIGQIIFPAVWCNDQEPLDHEFYKTHLHESAGDFFEILKSKQSYLYPKNLNYQQTIFKKGLLLHSEKRSYNLEKYKSDNELIPVYHWSHAIIARDWFRYAEHIKQNKQANKTFLIYNRAWSGTREYRLHFLELLAKLGLQHNCRTSVNAIEPELGIHYELYQFKNPAWRPQTVLENFFPTSTAHSHYSADFDIEDYEATDIEIVLETLFDDTRLHLTEKILRPIACGQPFILASTHGSLEYLRSYGFVTFGDVWNESYDLIQDPKERSNAIADLMKKIACWSPEGRVAKMAEAQAIAEYNRQHFFSQAFFNLVTNELKTNLKLAFDELEQCDNYQNWIDRWTTYMSYPEVVEFLNTNQDQTFPTINTVRQAQLIAQTRAAEVANKKQI